MSLVKRNKKLFNWNKRKNKPSLRIFCIGDVAIPQVYDDGYWKGVNKKGETYAYSSSQVEHCGLPTAEEAEKFLRTINIIYPKGL